MGFSADDKIVRAMVLFNRQSLFRTKMVDPYFPENKELQFRPKEVFCVDYLFTADGFRYTPFTQGVVSVVPPETLPWAEIYWPFRPGKYTELDLCLKGSTPSRVCSGWGWGYTSLLFSKFVS